MDDAQKIASLEDALRETTFKWLQCKAEHADMVKRCALLRERPDLPVDRIPAYNELVRLQTNKWRTVLATWSANVPETGESKRVMEVIKLKDYVRVLRNALGTCHHNPETGHMQFAWEDVECALEYTDDIDTNQLKV